MKAIVIALVAASGLFAGSLQVGEPLKQEHEISLHDLTAKPNKYVGKTFQVKGQITEVCQVMGCWIMLTDGNGASIRIQMQEGKVAFPKDAAGRGVVAEGKLAKYNLNKQEALDMAKHAAEDAGRPFHPEAVKAPYVFYQIEGRGAVLAE